MLSDSICFSPNDANLLNEKAFSIDPRLFLFAYYEPTPFSAEDSTKHQFISSVINLYGLIKDCSPFLTRLLSSRQGILIVSNWKSIRKNYFELYDTSRAFRSIFCHNNSIEYPLNEERVQIAEQWIMRICPMCQCIDDISDADWSCLLAHLERVVTTFVLDLKNCLDYITSLSDLSRKNDIINFWISCISDAYIRNPDYLLNSMAGLYQLYLLNINQLSNISLGKLRKDTIDWLCTNCGVSSSPKWYEKWYNQPSPSAASPNNPVLSLLMNWPAKWGEWYGKPADECDEPPLPCGSFFLVLAKDVVRYARHPFLGYHP